MKKEELILALFEVRKALRSQPIVSSFEEALTAQESSELAPFASGAMNNLVEGIGGFQGLSKSARQVCGILKISPYYDGASVAKTDILHHMARAKGIVQDRPFLSDPRTLSFIEAHRRVLTTSTLLERMLHAERPEGEMLLEGSSENEGLSLPRVQEILTAIEDLVAAYCESQGDTDKPKIEISYLDLGSDFQIGIKVDAKAEMGTKLTKFLTEIFRWMTNPRCYIKEANLTLMAKEIAMIADLQKRVDSGDITAATAQMFAERLVGGGKKLAYQHVFPAALIKERTVQAPVDELVRLLKDTAQRPEIPTLDFNQPPAKGLPSSESSS